MRKVKKTQFSIWNTPTPLGYFWCYFCLILTTDGTDSSYILTDDQEVCFCLPTNQKYYFYGQHSAHCSAFGHSILNKYILNISNRWEHRIKNTPKHWNVGESSTYQTPSLQKPVLVAHTSGILEELVVILHLLPQKPCTLLLLARKTKASNVFD